MQAPINIRQFLPHRKPMLMVDYVTHIDDKSITTNFVIDSDNLFLEDGVFNETGVIENAAQTCSGIVGWPHFELNSQKKDYRVDGFISKIERVEIFKLPPVNAKITTKGQLITMHPLGKMYNCKMKCSTFLNEKEIAHCNFTLIIQP